MMADRQPSSFDLNDPMLRAKLESFLARQWDCPVQISAPRRFPAGMSWITIGFNAVLGGPERPVETRELILRIGDPSGLLAPYFAEPEFLALSELAEIPGLPIPRAYAYSDDDSVIGAPFLVTERVAGDTPQPWKGAEGGRSAATNLSLGHDFVDGIAAIHAFDWRRSKLTRLAGNVPPEDVARCETQYWAKHAGAPARALTPQLHYAMRWLLAKAPRADRMTVVHGDYRVGNFLQVGGRITAILDWELVHLGDPHEDIAWAGLRTFAGGTGQIGGLMSHEDFYARYQEKTGFLLRPEVIRYYEVLVQFKLVAMLVGAAQRLESGRAKDVRMAAMGFQLATSSLELHRLIGEAG